MLAAERGFLTHTAVNVISIDDATTPAIPRLINSHTNKFARRVPERPGAWRAAMLAMRQHVKTSILVLAMLNVENFECATLQPYALAFCDNAS